MSAGSGPSRRGLLQSAGAMLAGAGALVAAGCGSSAAKRTTTATATVSPQRRAADLAILSAALELERRTIAAYVASIPLLDPADTMIAKQLLTQELAHTGELISLIRVTGGKPRPKANSYEIGSAHDARGALAILQSLEQLQLSNYVRVIPMLSIATTRAAVATILAADSQHTVALRLARGRPGISSALVA